MSSHPQPLKPQDLDENTNNTNSSPIPDQSNLNRPQPKPPLEQLLPHSSEKKSGWFSWFSKSSRSRQITNQSHMRQHFHQFEKKSQDLPGSRNKSKLRLSISHTASNSPHKSTNHRSENSDPPHRKSRIPRPKSLNTMHLGELTSLFDPEHLFEEAEMKQLFSPRVAHVNSDSFIESLSLIGLPSSSSTSPKILQFWPKDAHTPPNITMLAFPTPLVQSFINPKQSPSTLKSIIIHQPQSIGMAGTGDDIFVFQMTDILGNPIYGICLFKNFPTDLVIDWYKDEKEPTLEESSQSESELVYNNNNTPVQYSIDYLSNKNQENCKSLSISPRCYCVTSRHPYFSLHYQFLFHLQKLEYNPVAFRSFCKRYSLLSLKILSAPGFKFHLTKPTNSEIDDSNSSLFLKIPKTTGLQNAETFYITEWGGFLTLSLLSLENIILIIRAIVMEKKIIFHSKSPHRLSSVIFFLIQLIRPLKWQSVLLPILPQELIDYLDAPVPYILGCLNSAWGTGNGSLFTSSSSSSKSKYSKQKSKKTLNSNENDPSYSLFKNTELFYVDIDNNTIKRPIEMIPILPHQSQLRQVLVHTVQKIKNLSLDTNIPRFSTPKLVHDSILEFVSQWHSYFLNLFSTLHMYFVTRIQKQRSSSSRRLKFAPSLTSLSEVDNRHKSSPSGTSSDSIPSSSAGSPPIPKKANISQSKRNSLSLTRNASGSLELVETPNLEELYLAPSSPSDDENVLNIVPENLPTPPCSASLPLSSRQRSLSGPNIPSGRSSPAVDESLALSGESGPITDDASDSPVISVKSLQLPNNPSIEEEVDSLTENPTLSSADAEKKNITTNTDTNTNTNTNNSPQPKTKTRSLIRNSYNCTKSMPRHQKNQVTASHSSPPLVKSHSADQATMDRSSSRVTIFWKEHFLACCDSTHVPFYCKFFDTQIWATFLDSRISDVQEKSI